MSIEETTRALGAEIQLAPAYVRFVAAKEANDADEVLSRQMREIELLRMQYQHEAAKGASADEGKMDAYDEAFQQLYQTIMQNPRMREYQAAMDDMDALMKRVTGILSGCAMGEDPATFEPKDHDCGGDCGGCGGGCGHAR
ncbi:MAG: YlbF family regulator [Oscillospiraceae bacterium]|jgi:cell fate (sporulation/competence/biofilm development) regulator YlbF (YheA/YmcA/DUF963 family)|nr:YlbF family regulator [Oscillospiraceae bacterium]